ncbi:MAG: phosphoribosylformylglycinamidine synthase subunit PurS [Candidatus Gastranaerophilales bacterium]|nr:phosphoribosylformylglycinamidine synthase subunit PurS [Candidatus Gastranaerophilales bacterium]
MFLAKITVKFKKGVKNPEAQTLETLLARLGENNVQEVVCSKNYELVLAAFDSKEASCKANDIANKVLANPIIEDYEVQICELL